MSRLYSGLKPPPCLNCNRPILRKGESIPDWQKRKYCDRECTLAATTRKRNERNANAKNPPR